MNLKLDFNLPFRFVDPGTYTFRYSKSNIMLIIKLVQNYDSAERVFGLKITGSDGGHVDYNADNHGLLNHSQIEFFVTDNTECNLNNIRKEFPNDPELALKNFALVVLNRLVEIVRYYTNNYWLRFISLRDMVNFRVNDLSKNSKQFMMSFNFGHGYNSSFLKVIEQSQLAEKIIPALNENLNIPTWKNLLLDSINYFTVDRYNDSVLLVNVALESFVANHLYEVLNSKNADRSNNLLIIKQLPKSLHKTFKKHFLKIDGRDFTMEAELWNIFEEARNIRTDAAHSFTKKIDQGDASQTIRGVIKIMKWMNKDLMIDQ